MNISAKMTKMVIKANSDESAAISKALSHWNDVKLRFIEDVIFDKEKKVWLVKISELGSNHILYVNLKTGEVGELKNDPPQKSEPQKKPEAKQPPQQNQPKPAPASPQLVAQNDSFRIFQPAPNEVVGNTLVVKRQARVFEAVVSYSLEDGHNYLAKGHVQASKGAPEWGSFEIKLNIDHATSPSGVLSIYEENAKDGSPSNVLLIPVKFK